MKKIINKLFTIAILLLLIQKGYSQAVISGPSCIVPNTTYQYVVSGNFDSVASVQVCVSQGIVLDSLNGNTCTAFTSKVNEILVIWNDSAATAGSLTATFSGSNTTLAVHFAPELLPGLIDSSSKLQILDSVTVPAVITCGIDSGGACSPSYTYQWQSSLNQVKWVDIPSATGKDLAIDTALKQTTFFRRQVTEVKSRTIGYSDAASVLVVIPQADTTQTGQVNIRQNKRLDISILQIEHLSHAAGDAKPILPLLQRGWLLKNDKTPFKEVYSTI